MYGKCVLKYGTLPMALIMNLKLAGYFCKASVICSQEKSPLIVPWIIGCITFMALEAMAMVYSNVLRDHVNRVSNFYINSSFE